MRDWKSIEVDQIHACLEDVVDMLEGGGRGTRQRAAGAAPGGAGPGDTKL